MQTRLDHFEIVRTLGAGGMGEVLLARDLELERFVAIKVLHSNLAPWARQQILREARNASALNHPRITAIHQIVLESNPQFIVMEYVDGVTLESRIHGGAISLLEARRWCKQLCDALT